MRRSAPQARRCESSSAPKFSYIYSHLFKSCSLAMCHGGGIAGVDMATQDAAYASLVEQPPQAMGRCEKSGLVRVAPGAPERSLLAAKLEIDAPCGQQMPIGGLLPDADRALNSRHGSRRARPTTERRCASDQSALRSRGLLFLASVASGSGAVHAWARAGAPSSSRGMLPTTCAAHRAGFGAPAA